MQYVLLARMKRASLSLAFNKDQSVLDIALQAHFDSAEAFSRAFSRTFKQSPSQFRRCPNWENWHRTYDFALQDKEMMNLDVKIVMFDKRQVALLRHQGTESQVFQTAERFVEWATQNPLKKASQKREIYTVTHSERSDLGDEMQLDICGTHEGEVSPNQYGVVKSYIPEGRCAVVRHTGSYESAGKTCQEMYRSWLPTSHEELRDFPCFFHYLNFAHEVDECELITDIYLPIK